jgi:hypothetical protein
LYSKSHIQRALNIEIVNLKVESIADHCSGETPGVSNILK